MAHRTVSVVIPTMNRRTDLAVCLEHILAQTVKPLEMVVVDAGDDRVEDLLVESLNDSGIELQYLRSEPGTSIQRNVGIEKTRGEVLLFLDDDMLMTPDYIERTLECFDVPADPPVGGVMGTLKNPTLRLGWRGLYSRIFGLTHAGPGDEAKMYPSGGVHWLADPSRVVPIPVAATGRAALLRVCFENERFEDYLPGYTHAEDVEVTHRIAKRWTLLQTPFARVHHGVSQAGEHRGPGERAGRIIFSQYYFFSRHRPKDPLHLLAYLWASAGLSGFCVAQALARGDLRPTLRGLAYGYRLCAADLFGKGD